MGFNTFAAGSLGALMLAGGVAAILKGAPMPVGLLVVFWGLYNLVFFFRTAGKTGDVVAEMDGLTVDQAGSKQRFTWNQVRECARVRNGPLISWYQSRIYRLAFNGSDLIIYFVPGPDDLRPQGLWEPHYQTMVELIQHRIAQSRES